MIDTWSEAYRHQCEVREIIRLRLAKGRVWAAGHMAAIEKIRGRKARARLEADIVTQWRRGNRGEGGLWFADDVA